MGKGNVVVAPNGDRKLKFPTALRLALWSDGFQVDDAPFRSYAVDSARAFVRDLVDGYFPYEMKVGGDTSTHLHTLNAPPPPSLDTRHATLGTLFQPLSSPMYHRVYTPCVCTCTYIHQL